MLTWQGASSPRLESVRLLFSIGHRLRASGRVIVAADAGHAYSADFELSVDETGVVRRLLLRSTALAHERQISLSRSAEGSWLIDDGSGARRGQFDGAVDVDIEDVALTNALPIRRLGLHRESAEYTLPVLFVSLPDLSVQVVHQTYRTVATITDGAVVRYESGAFGVDLSVDSDGMVLDYPDLVRRV